MEDCRPSRTLATDCSKEEHAVKTAWSPSIIHPDVRWQCQAPYMQEADLLIGPVWMTLGLAMLPGGPLSSSTLAHPV